MADPIYSAQGHVEGGRREGHGHTSDGKLEVDLDLPAELGGRGAGTNPEQLFAVGYAACFLEALKSTGRREGLRVDEAAIDSDVHLLKREGGGFELGVALRVSLPSLEPEEAQRLVAAADETCPYSRALRGNVAVDLQVQGATMEARS
jgi:osmotically inducible protein OsmC